MDGWVDGWSLLRFEVRDACSRPILTCASEYARRDEADPAAPASRQTECAGGQKEAGGLEGIGSYLPPHPHPTPPHPLS